MDELEMKSFEIIASVGSAKSSYVEAIRLASMGQYEEAKEKIDEGNDIFVQGHLAHASLIQKEAAGDKVYVTLLLTHAEDQLMSAEVIKLMALEMIKLYEKVGA